MGTWRVVEFSSERGFGLVREAETGREATFGIEAWWRCDPVTARRIDDSDARRSLLLPRAGERVEITWKTRAGRERAARVARVEALEAPLARVALRPWLEALGAHVPEVADWSAAEWDEVLAALSDDASDSLREPADPATHLAFLAWLRRELPAHPIVARRLAWIRDDGNEALEGMGDDPAVHVSLSRAREDALAAAKLARRA